ncbi:MAG: hypothetical protein Q9220_002828 [cf. Caloplaca sp. 1 TL-2023]
MTKYGPPTEEQREGKDIATAIEVSLHSQNPNLPQDQRRWIPESGDDWMIYRRQKARVDTAEKVRDLLEDGQPEASWAKKPSFENLRRSLPRIQEEQYKPEANKRFQSTSPPMENSAASHPTPEPQPDNTSCRRQTIEDRIREMQLGVISELPRTNDKDGDTYVFIDPPAQQPEQTSLMYEAYSERCKKPLVIRSAALKNLHSPFIDKLLGPTAQHRSIRRRGLKGNLPDRIKYVVDLTPPMEGDDAAWLMTELCCVEGVRNWSQSHERWQVSKTLVGGSDEFTLPAKDVDDLLPPPELSPIRHRNSIERVLNAARGMDPDLDSAVKVYTTFAVARFFDIVHSPLTDYIVRWLRAPPNSLFIEALPEIALKIGDGFQCYELVRDSFAILVGEGALASINGNSVAATTVFGRKRNDVIESYITRIQYASRSLVERVSQDFQDLVEPEMPWIEQLPQFQILSKMSNAFLGHMTSKVKATLKMSVRGAIYNVLYSDITSAPEVALGSQGGDCLYPRTERVTVWNALDVSERILTLTFWDALRAFCLGHGLSNTTSLSDWSSKLWAWGARLPSKKRAVMKQEHRLSEVLFAELQDLTSAPSNSSGPRWVRTSSDEPVAPSNSPWPGWVRTPSDRSVDGSLNDTTSSQTQQQQPAIESKTSEVLWSAEGIHPGSRLMWVHKDDDNGPSDDHAPSTASAGPSHALQPEQTVELFSLDRFFKEAEDYLLALCRRMTSPPDKEDREEPMMQVMNPTLVCLNETEWKYLPLYAGGLDDGSGGVFNDDVPMAEAGFSTAGPSVHTGTGSSAASSEYDMVVRLDLESTHHTSTMTNDSFSDQLDQRKVYDEQDDLWDRIRRSKDTAGSTISSHVETATMAAPSTMDAESEDGFVLPLRTKEKEIQVSNTVQGTEHEVLKKHQMQQEDYSDLFMEDDNDGGEEEEDMDDDDNELIDDGDDDDDTATEKGDDDERNTDAGKGLDSDDEDMVII